MNNKKIIDFFIEGSPDSIYSPEMYFLQTIANVTSSISYMVKKSNITLCPCRSKILSEKWRTWIVWFWKNAYFLYESHMDLCNELNVIFDRDRIFQPVDKFTTGEIERFIKIHRNRVSDEFDLVCGQYVDKIKMDASISEKLLETFELVHSVLVKYYKTQLIKSINSIKMADYVYEFGTILKRLAYNSIFEMSQLRIPCCKFKDTCPGGEDDCSYFRENKCNCGTHHDELNSGLMSLLIFVTNEYNIESCSRDLVKAWSETVNNPERTEIKLNLKYYRTWISDSVVDLIRSCSKRFQSVVVLDKGSTGRKEAFNSIKSKLGKEKIKFRVEYMEDSSTGIDIRGLIK